MNQIEFKTMETKSYKKMIQAHVMGMGVCREEQRDYYREVHRIMAHAGIIDPQTLIAERKRPFKNSPWGEFVNYEYRNGKRVHVDAYMLNENGIKEVQRILTNFVTERYLTKGKLTKADPFLKEIRNSVDGATLIHWLRSKGIEFTETEKNGEPHLIMFRWNGIKYTCYHETHLVVSDKSRENVFWFIKKQETHALSAKRDEARVSMAILSTHWNIKFGNKVEDFGDKEAEVRCNTPTITEHAPNSDLMSRLLDEISSLRAEVAELRQGKSSNKVTEHQKSDEKVRCKSLTPTKDDIISKITALVKPQRMQKRYKTISLEQIAKESKKERREALQQAYDELSRRRLLTAAYRPVDGWKFNFEQQSVELLYRVSNRTSAVYNTKHRPLHPINGIKELANKGEKYNLPYGLEKIDYSFKTIFLTEGAYDSCFLKNCLAQGNWILPHEMSKVIDIFREAGFQIIHIPNNFRIKDKGGLKFYEQLVTSRDWLSKGDKMFSWDIYGDSDDLNEIAMKHNLDEIDAQTIIEHSWGEDEVRANYPTYVGIQTAQNSVTDELHKTCEGESATDETQPETAQEVTEEDLDSLLEELWSQEQKPTPKPKMQREKDKLHKTCEDKPYDRKTNPCAMETLYQYLDELEQPESATVDDEPHKTCEDDWETVLAEMEAVQNQAKAEQKEREEQKRKYEEFKEQEMREMNRTMDAIYNPQPYLYKTPGITIEPPKVMRT